MADLSILNFVSVTLTFTERILRDFILAGIKMAGYISAEINAEMLTIFVKSHRNVSPPKIISAEYFSPPKIIYQKLRFDRIFSHDGIVTPSPKFHC